MSVLRAAPRPDSDVPSPARPDWPAMRVEVRASSVTLTGAQAERLDRRLSFALGRFGAEVESVQVSLADLNGPRGGIDKSCRMTARLTSGGRIHVQDVGGSLDALIDRSADRLGHSVSRELGRRRERSPRKGSARPHRAVAPCR